MSAGCLIFLSIDNKRRIININCIIFFYMIHFYRIKFMHSVGMHF